MSSQTNKELWKRWGDLWNGNLSIADEIIAPNFVAHFAPAGMSPAEVRGPDGLKQWMKIRSLVAGSFALHIKVACQALRLARLANASSTQGWTSFASKPEKSSSTGSVLTFCNYFNK